MENNKFPADFNRDFSLAVQLHRAGELPKAAIIYKKLLAYSPSNSQILSLLGTVELFENNLDSGIELLKKSLKINPNQKDVRINYSNALILLGRLDEALESSDEAVRLSPNDFDLIKARAILLYDLKRPNEALESYNKAILINQNDPDVFNNRAVILQELNQMDLALESYNKAISINSNDPEMFNNRAALFKKLKKFDLALESCKASINLDSKNSAVYFTRGNIYLELCQLDKALTDYDTSISLNPTNPECHLNRGVLLGALRKYREAIESFDQTIFLQKDCSEAYANKAIFKLLLGDYKEGWSLYEWRWKVEDRPIRIHSSQHLWLGERSLENKTLLIYFEQGFGDLIQFSRYANMAINLGAKVIFEVPRNMTSMLSTLEGSVEIIEFGNPLPNYDYEIPLMSLPLAFGTELTSIPNKMPYLFADEIKKYDWKRILGAKEIPKIGICWSGSRGHKLDAYPWSRRYISFEKINCLFELPFEFHVLQTEFRDDDVVEERFENVYFHQNVLLNFSDTAALIENLDLVISVDTSVAHLAGALGKPVWITLPYSADYRWMIDRNDSPWYPTARLFRQSISGDWDSVIKEVQSELVKLFIT